MRLNPGFARGGALLAVLLAPALACRPQARTATEGTGGTGVGPGTGGGAGSGAGTGSGGVAGGNGASSGSGGAVVITIPDGGVDSIGGGDARVVKMACADGTLPADPKMPGYPASQHAMYLAMATSKLRTLSSTDKTAQIRGTDPGPATMRNFTDIFRNPDNTAQMLKGFLYRDGPRGVNLDAPIQASGASHGRSTVFPVPMARGAAWDVDLEYRIGQTMGDEAVAAGQSMLLAPTVNILRHPLWGRAQETYGEDPFQLGRLGTSSVAGIQEYVAACVKHYAANNIENLRSMKNAMMDEQTLREIYARHFEMIVKDGGAACVMAAYNLVNGTSSSQNKHLLTDILRTDFGFQGFVLSDWWAMPGGSGGVPNATTAAGAIAAGLDMELPWNWHYGLVDSLLGSTIMQSQVDTAVTRILEQKYRFRSAAVGATVGIKSAATGYSGGSITGNDAHISIALEAALKSMVLLKNSNNTLPINRGGTIRNIAVVGTHEGYARATATSPGINNLADDPINMGMVNFPTTVRIGDVGSSRVNYDPTKGVGPLAGIQAAAGTGITVTSGNTVAAAQNADFVVVVAGLTPYDEGEEYNGSGDRTTFALNGKLNVNTQNTLITQVATLGKPMVVVLEGGSVIDMPWLSTVPAVVMAWYPGMKGGTALGQLLFGDANFSGKLSITWGTNLTQYPTFNGGATTTMDYDIGYRRFDRLNLTPLFPLGHGLSYTTFQYGNLVVPCSTAKIPTATASGSVIDVQLDVFNTGTVAGDEVVLLFVSYPSSTARRPIKELKGFIREAGIAPGTGHHLHIPVRVSDLKYFDMTSNTWKVETGPVKIMVGPKIDNLPLSDTVMLQ